MHPEYINETLVHWTGRDKSEEEAFKIVKAICEENILRLTYCPNYVHGEFQKNTQMVCFTDLPLRFSHIHCSRFGRFGVGFNKQSMIGYGANPVFYTTGKHFDQVKNISSLLDRMKDLERDRSWREKSEPYRFSEDETVALLDVMGFLQEYSYRNDDDSEDLTYYQREWRLTFDSLPFAGGTSPHTPGKSCFYTRDGKSYPIFKFTNSDVVYIVVPRGFVERGRPVAQALGCAIRAYEDEVDVQSL